MDSPPPENEAFLRPLVCELRRRREARERVVARVLEGFELGGRRCYVGRAQVHEFVCDGLGLAGSNDDCLMVRAVLASMGVLPVNRHGRLLYRGLRPRA